MNIINTKDIQHQHLTVLIYGTPGMGKTTLLGNLKGRTLIVDVDKGTSVLTGCENVDVLRINKGADELRQVINELKAKCDYDNVCIDSLSELEGSMLSELGRKGRNNRVPELGDYNREMQPAREHTKRSFSDTLHLMENLVIYAEGLLARINEEEEKHDNGTHSVNDRDV